jgi:hypothetical protein
MSEVVTADQIEAFRTNGFVVDDDPLTDAELDTFEPLVTAASRTAPPATSAHSRNPERDLSGVPRPGPGPVVASHKRILN